MKLSFLAMLLAIAAPASPQTSVAAEVQDYSLEADNLVDALVKVSAQFKLPMGLEWVKSADMLRPVRYSSPRTTVNHILQEIISKHAGYSWRTEDGIIHVFQSELLKDSRNPLNINLTSQVLKLTVPMINNDLFQRVRHDVRLPELQGIAGSVPGYPGEPVFSFDVGTSPVRKTLNQIVKSGIGIESASSKHMPRIWIATFPANQTISRTGFLEVVPMYNPTVVPTQDQPFWILLRWGDSPLESMTRQ